MHTNIDALKILESRLDIAEAGQSSYWQQEGDTYTINAAGALAGAPVLGSLSTKRSIFHVAAHWILQVPFRLMIGSGGRLGRIEHFGRLIAERTGRAFTHDMLRQVLSLTLISKHINLEGRGDCNLVIGDGFGVLTSLFLLAVPERKTIIVNLSKSLLLDLVYIQRAVPDVGIALADNEEDVRQALSDPTIRLIALQADNAACATVAPIGISANVVSMQEMDPDVVSGYFRILRDNPAKETVFYCANKLTKTLPDGTEVRFKNYPWMLEDHIFHNSACPWSQWYYSKTPPFWHYRRGKGRIIWHRLAGLQKKNDQ